MYFPFGTVILTDMKLLFKVVLCVSIDRKHITSLNLGKFSHDEKLCSRKSDENQFSVKFTRFFEKILYFVIRMYFSLFLNGLEYIFLSQRQSLIVPLIICNKFSLSGIDHSLIIRWVQDISGRVWCKTMDLNSLIYNPLGWFRNEIVSI